MKRTGSWLPFQKLKIENLNLCLVSGGPNRGLFMKLPTTGLNFSSIFASCPIPYFNFNFFGVFGPRRDSNRGSPDLRLTT